MTKNQKRVLFVVLALVVVVLIIILSLVLVSSTKRSSSTTTNSHDVLPPLSPLPSISSGSNSGSNLTSTSAPPPQSTSSVVSPSPTANVCGSCACDYGFGYAYNQQQCSSNKICASECPYCVGYVYNSSYGTCSSTSAVQSGTVTASDGTSGTYVYVPLGSDLVFMSLSFSTPSPTNIEYINMPVYMSTDYPTVLDVYASCEYFYDSPKNPNFVIEGLPPPNSFLANSSASPLYIQSQFNMSTQLYVYNGQFSNTSGPIPQAFLGGGGFYACGVVYLASPVVS